MFLWLSENLGTIVVALALAAAVSMIILKMWKDRKQGKSSCCGSCSHCAMCGACRQ